MHVVFLPGGGAAAEGDLAAARGGGACCRTVHRMCSVMMATPACACWAWCGQRSRCREQRSTALHGWCGLYVVQPEVVTAADAGAGAGAGLHVAYCPLLVLWSWTRRCTTCLDSMPCQRLLLRPRAVGYCTNDCEKSCFMSCPSHSPLTQCPSCNTNHPRPPLDGTCSYPPLCTPSSPRSTSIIPTPHVRCTTCLASTPCSRPLPSAAG